MPRMSSLLLLSILLLLPSTAAATNTDAKILVHLLPGGGNGCTRTGRGPECAGVITNGGLASGYYAYVLVQQGDATAGVAGLEFGVDYDAGTNAGIDIFGWTRCATQELQEAGWPGAGTGNIVIWNDGACQRTEPGGPGTGVVAVAGYFYLWAHTPDDLQITPRAGDGQATVVDCQVMETVLASSALGYARFSSGASLPGNNPCSGLPPPPPPSPYTCDIDGPAYAATGSPVEYSIETSHPASSYSWTVNGSGAILGSTTGSSVTVQPGNPGTFILSVVFGVPEGGTGECQKNVSVSEILFVPQCSVEGPGGALSNATGLVYSISTNTTAAAYAWSVGAGATIVGSSSGSSIVVTAGPGPLFAVRVTYQTTGGDSADCVKFVQVTSTPSCPNPCGPNEVWERSLTTFTSVNMAWIPQTFWSVTGNASIEGPADQSSAKVRAGEASGGSFTVKVDIDGQLPVEGASPGLIHTRTVAVLATPSAPAGWNENARIMIHLTPPATDGPCELVPSCTSVITSGSLHPQHYFAYVVVAGAYSSGAPRSGISGVQFGIDYDGAGQSGVDIFSWTSCGSTETPSSGWPGPGGGNLITWNSVTRCQTEEPDVPPQGASATSGYFYLTAYSPDALRITPRPDDGFAMIRDCLLVDAVIEADGVVQNPSRLGTAAFSADGAVPGYNPCNTSTPVVLKTWSGIKALYRH